MNKKLPLMNILITSWKYCLSNFNVCAIFTALFYIMGALAVWSWKTWMFMPIVVGLYVLWGVFFRVYFNRRPYFMPKSLFNSLLPSTKIVLLTIVVATLFIMLQFVPLFINVSPEFNQKYAQFLQGDIERNGVLVLITNLLFLMVSPQIAYRPFLGWISALIGRSGSLKIAWEKTKGNYKEFLIISLLTDCLLTVIRWGIVSVGGNDYVTMVFAAPLIVYFNVISAQAYEFFFLNKE